MDKNCLVISQMSTFNWPTEAMLFYLPLSLYLAQWSDKKKGNKTTENTSWKLLIRSKLRKPLREKFRVVFKTFRSEAFRFIERGCKLKKDYQKYAVTLNVLFKTEKGIC